ncbi:DUF3168 domain-containing protein [Brucellaceae bacterium C25G]
MSVSVSLANFIVDTLLANPAVTALVGNRIWDHPSSNPQFPYITLGSTDFTLDDADCIDAREETIQIDVWSRDGGRKWPCKQIVDAVVKALRHPEGELANGALIDGRIDIARVMDDPDGITVHGVVQFTAIIEE